MTDFIPVRVGYFCLGNLWVACAVIMIGALVNYRKHKIRAAHFRKQQQCGHYSLGTVMTALCLSEIRCSVASFWGEMWMTRIGDSISVHLLEGGTRDWPTEIAERLTLAICAYLPESDFAQNVDDLPEFITYQIVSRARKISEKQWPEGEQNAD